MNSPLKNSTNIILFSALFAYSWIVAQSFMYIIALENVQLAMDAPSYIELRHLLDTNFRANFKFAVIGALVSTLLLVLVTAKNYRSGLFAAALFGFLALVVDLIFTVKGNMPINELISTWTSTNHPANWSEVRAEWLRFFHYRQIANGSGFVVLLAATIFRRA